MGQWAKGVEVFSSAARLQHCFHLGLQLQLQRQGLGSFILACANACNDAVFFQTRQAALAQGFRHWAHILEQQDEILESAAAEDLQVWRSLQAMGFAALSLTEYRRLGIWQIQFNRLRSLRPRRLSQADVSVNVYRPFDPGGFHFNKPFMVEEIFWSGVLQERRVDLFYNKYPFMPLHGLLVVERSRNAPQYLTTKDHEYLWRLTRQLGATLPGIGFGYNALGAFASVNHQHFQMFVEQALPVEASGWTHQGGSRDYPLPCMHFDDMEAAWDVLACLQEDNIAFNLLYRPGGCYVLARHKQGQHRVEPWSSGFTWYEACGGFLVAAREDYECLQASRLEQALGALRLPG